MSDRWTWKKTGQTVVVIAIALLLGLIVDQLFASHNKYTKRPLLFILLQFLGIIAVVAALESIHLKRYPLPITSNIFFISVFLAVQQNLWKEVSRIRLWPKLGMMSEDERKQML